MTTTTMLLAAAILAQPLMVFALLVQKAASNSR
jgi:hypothetical protein